MAITFSLLALAICAVWLPPVPMGKCLRLPLWPVFFGGAIASGLVAAYLTWQALPALGGLCLAACLARRETASRLQRTFFAALAALMVLALALHRLPGFMNPLLLANVKSSADAAPFTLYANFDKAAAGLVVLAWLCNRAQTIGDWQGIWRRTWPVVLATCTTVLLMAVALGLVRFDPKLPDYTPLFLVINLLFTCVAEEAFFRGFLQARLTAALGDVRFGGALAILISGLLFGAVHAGGGSAYLALASLAGLGYAYAYACTRKVEAAIIVHFAVNAVQFIGFTYPRLG